VHIQRIGFTPLKGGRHVEQAAVTLSPDGPTGDRVFSLVDPARERVLRTVENPTLLQAEATWDAGVLTVHLPGRTVEGTPQPTGDEVKVDYWGRMAGLEIMDGPWAAAFSAHLGFEVLVARASRPGEVVYGASVSLVTTSSLQLLEDRLGRPAASERFRPTFLLDSPGLEPHGEDAWLGRELDLGEARVRVHSILPRCAVIDLDPETGRRDLDVLGTLARYRRGRGEINFGVDAVVTAAGRVRSGDLATLGRD
jgi:uncharacterized protein YcbX